MRGPRYSIIPGDFVDDTRPTFIHYQVLNQLGRRTNAAGWCWVSQSKLAERLDVARQTVNRAIADLVRWGYLEKRSQSNTRRNICHYRVVIDADFDRAEGHRRDGSDPAIGDAGDASEGSEMPPVPLSSVDDNGGLVSPTDDTSVTSRGDTSVRSRGDTITTPLNNNPPHTTSARRGATCVRDKNLGEGEGKERPPPPPQPRCPHLPDDLRARYPSAVGHAIDRLWFGIPRRPGNVLDWSAVIAEMARIVGQYPPDDIRRATDAAIEARSVLPSGAILKRDHLEPAAEARLRREAHANTRILVPITENERWERVKAAATMAGDGDLVGRMEAIERERRDGVRRLGLQRAGRDAVWAPQRYSSEYPDDVKHAATPCPVVSIDDRRVSPHAVAEFVDPLFDRFGAPDAAVEFEAEVAAVIAEVRGETADTLRAAAALLRHVGTRFPVASEARAACDEVRRRAGEKS